MSTSSENPYQTPATVAAGYDPAFPPGTRIRLFGTPMVLLAGLLCTPLPALVMLAINCRRLGWRGLMWGMVAAGAVALGLSAAPILFDLSPVTLGVLFLAQYVPLAAASMWIWHRTKNVRLRGSYRYTTYGFSILITLLAFVPVLVLTVLATVTLYISRGTPVELAGGHACYLSGDATEDDALFVGEHLVANGCLGDEEASTLFLGRAGGQFTLSLVVTPYTARDRELRQRLRSAGEELADLRLGRPLVVRMVDEFNRQVYWDTTIEPEGGEAGEPRKDDGPQAPES